MYFIFSHKKTILLFVFLLFIVICLFLLKREIGILPSSIDVKQYEHKEYLGRKYFYDGRFHNIFNSIDGYKIPSDKEDNSKNFNIITMLTKRYQKPKNSIIQMKQLSKNDFQKDIKSDKFYWLGHSSLIFELSGKRIIIDPVFDNASPVKFIMKRWNKSPIQRTDLPEIDYVLITHNHYDHLERKTIQYLKNSYFIVPLGIKSILIYWGIDEKHITEIGWGEKFETDNIIFNAEPTLHFTQRFLNDTNKTLWNSYVIQTKVKNNSKIDKQIFISGDGGYGENIKHISKKYHKYGKFNLIAVEIDAWNIRWPFLHMFPRENIEVIKQFNPDMFLPVHYGVYPLGMHEYDLSINMIKELAKGHKLIDKLLIPKIGEGVFIK